MIEINNAANIGDKLFAQTNIYQTV